MGHHFKKKEYDITATEFQIYSNKNYRRMSPGQTLMEYGAQILKESGIEVLNIGQNHITVRCNALPSNIEKFRHVIKRKIKDSEFIRLK